MHFLLAAIIPSLFAGSGGVRRDSASNTTFRIGLVRAFPHASSIIVQARAGLRVSTNDRAHEAAAGGEWVIMAAGDSVTVTEPDGMTIVCGPVIRLAVGADDTGPIAVRSGRRARHYRGILEFRIGTHPPTPSRSGRGSMDVAHPAVTPSLTPSLSGRGSTEPVIPLLRIAPQASTMPVSPSPGRGGTRGGVTQRAISTESTLLVINELPLEDYIRGVVAAEIGGSAPSEAQKAQAVAARTYALKVRGKYRGAPYDLNDTTDSQIYEGADGERAATDSAVRETAGIVLKRDGQLVLTDYYDDCGGVTSCGDGDADYPPSVADAPGDGRPDYCASGAYHTWSMRLTVEQVVACISSRDRLTLGRLRAIRVAECEPSGRVRRVELEGESGTVSVRGATLRGRIGYDRLKSTLFTIRPLDDGSFEFAGKGWGHGHGLCQAGAIGMASAPYNLDCRAILLHYFPGSEVAPLQPAESEAARPSRP